MRQFLRSSLGILFSVFSWPALAGPVSGYAVVPLVTGNYFLIAPRAINNSGEVIGTIYVDDAGAELHGFANRGGVTTLFGTLGGRSSDALGINNAGEVVGRSETAAGIFHATLYSGGTVTDLGAPPGRESQANGIGSAGMVVGNIPCNCGDYRAVRFDASGIHELGTLGGSSSTAYAVNGAGQAVGFSYLDALQSPRAFLYEHGVMTDLGTLGGDMSAAYAINEAGDIAGESFVAGAGFVARPFLYAHGVMTNLGSLNGADTSATALNNVGQVVGTASFGFADPRGFLWQDGVLYDLNALVDPASGWHIEDARGINDSGQIAARGCNAALGMCGVLRLDPASLSPVPEPGGYALLAGGLALLGAVRRRRA